MNTLDFAVNNLHKKYKSFYPCLYYKMNGWGKKVWGLELHLAFYQNKLNSSAI